mgnify:CR=1 FL=1
MINFERQCEITLPADGSRSIITDDLREICQAEIGKYDSMVVEERIVDIIKIEAE